ncbi:MAG: hypothetical protein A2063_04025 [Gallionellales bacterium GWA2_60_142]|nr:MAG: hypothetical protein A2063_04025 [Gallionellales bacterium GWA2_60_142]HCI14291.1 hypothetical protein [Gallionellaceae bacterium]
MTDFLSELANTNTDLLFAGLISAIVSAMVSYLFKRRETRHQAEVEYEYEQRKKLQELTGRYHGRLLNAANSLNYRIWNLYSNHQEGWHNANGNYEQAAYYFQSTAYRLMNFFALIRLIERESILLDARIATKKDFAFLNYAAAFHWVMTDVELFKGLNFDKSKQQDHFFSDHFRHYCELFLKNNENLSYETFKSDAYLDKQFSAVLAFIDGVSPSEERLRWNRIVCLHLLLMAFINTFGYTRQKSKTKQFLTAAKNSTNVTCLNNLLAWLPRHDLHHDQNIKDIVKAIDRINKEVELGLLKNNSQEQLKESMVGAAHHTV